MTENSFTTTRVRNLCEISDECNVVNPSWLGDSYCDDWAGNYNTEACCWDGGDCRDDPTEQELFFGDCKVSAECSVGVYDWNELGNGYCNDFSPYNTEACCGDGGDCSRVLSEGAIIAIAFAALIFVCCFLAACRSSTNSAGTSTAQPAAAATPITAPPFTEEEMTSQRRELILMSIIHKKVQSKSSKVPVEHDIVVDLEQAPLADEEMDLPHKEILSLRSLNIILASPIGTTAEQLNGNGDPDEIYNDDDEVGIVVAPVGDLRWAAGANNITSGVFGNKNDIMIETLRSIRSSLNISIIDESSLYSPKSCPICCDDYAKGDDIAWSKNEQCCHAFHTDCIMQWLMNHDDCPMCRNNYLEGTGAA